LRGKSQEIQSGSPARLDSPAELPRQSPRNLVNIGTQVLIEEFAETRIVVDAVNDPANLTALLHPVERGIDSGAASEVQKVAWRECPPYSGSPDPVFSLIFNRLAHI
jgi:hypothetical protein